jgi:hypothetical protein
MTDVRLAQPTQAGKGDRRASGSSCTTLPRSPGRRLGHALGHGRVWCPQFESEKPSGDAGFRPKIRTEDTTRSRQEKASALPMRRRPEHLVTCGISGFEMARPGLEPGTPRFSVVDRDPSNYAESPAFSGVYVGCERLEKSAICICFSRIQAPNRASVPKRQGVPACLHCSFETGATVSARAARRCCSSIDVDSRTRWQSGCAGVRRSRDSRASTGRRPVDRRLPNAEPMCEMAAGAGMANNPWIPTPRGRTPKRSSSARSSPPTADRRGAAALPTAGTRDAGDWRIAGSAHRLERLDAGPPIDLVGRYLT